MKESEFHKLQPGDRIRSPREPGRVLTIITIQTDCDYTTEPPTPYTWAFEARELRDSGEPVPQTYIYVKLEDADALRHELVANT